MDVGLKRGVGQDRSASASDAELEPTPGSPPFRNTFCYRRKVQDAYSVYAFFEDRCLVPGPRSRVPGTWDRIEAEDRRPRLAAGKPAHGVCILYPAS